MNGNIFLIKDDGRLVEMKEQNYDSEDLLQKLLSEYPDLLDGSQINSVSPRRWLLIDREASIPSEDGGSGRWAVDHLFLDQDAIPTLVEVKRSNDTRIRREVVGQMMDYAANAVVYWPIEEIRYKFEAKCEDPEQILEDFIGEDSDPDQFWEKVKTNLKAGKIRMLFVADEIPPELQRIVEFLNEQMDPAEVLAVEIKQYVGYNLKNLVPRVLGKIPDKNIGPRPKKHWDEASFIEEIETGVGMAEANIVRNILDWGKSKNLIVRWGQGRISGSFKLIFRHKEKEHNLFSISTQTPGKVWIEFGEYQKYPPFDSIEKRKEILSRIESIPNISIPSDILENKRYPNFPLPVLKDESISRDFLNFFEWFIEKIIEA